MVAAWFRCKPYRAPSPLQCCAQLCEHLLLMQGSPAVTSAPLELSFLESYGEIARHVWFGDGFVMVGFKSGQVVVVSSLRCAGLKRDVAACHKARPHLKGAYLYNSLPYHAVPTPC